MIKMLRKIFSKGKKKSDEARRQHSKSLVDDDETIIINLSGTVDSVSAGATEPVDLHKPEDNDLDPPENVQLAVAAEPKLRLGKDDGPVDDPPPPNNSENIVKNGDETIILRATSNSGDPAIEMPQNDDTTAAALCVITKANYGRTFRISTGRNTIGRATDNDITLDLGDQKISNRAHVNIAADPKTKKFYLVQGESRNLAYLNSEPLLGPTELSDKDKIQIGDTEFVFVQYFGNYLDWR
jgi:pSer/pThr/pTyr-binding forkhead associated (FHA) protein